MARNVAIRLGTEGKAQIKADLDDIAGSGDATAKRWARSFDRAGEDVEAAMRRQANAAAKLAAIMPQTAIQMRINDTNSTGFGQFEGSARQSASVFRDAIAAQEALEAKARALRAAIDPAWAAQERFNKEVGQARTLVSAGAISLDDYCAKLRVEKQALDAVVDAKGKANISTGQLRAGTQQLSYQISDVSASFASGTPLVTIFGQQAGQTVQAIQLMTGATEGFIGFLAGPWGAVLTGGVVLLTSLAASYFSASEKTDKATEAQKAQVGSAEALDAANKLLNETLGQSIKTQAQVRAEAIGLAEANLRAGEAARKRAADEISLARALLVQTQARSRQGGDRGDVAAMGIPGDFKAIEKLEADLAKKDAVLGQLSRNLNRLKTEDRRLGAIDTADRADADAKLLASAGKTG